MKTSNWKKEIEEDSAYERLYRGLTAKEREEFAKIKQEPLTKEELNAIELLRKKYGADRSKMTNEEKSFLVGLDRKNQISQANQLIEFMNRKDK